MAFISASSVPGAGSVSSGVRVLLVEDEPKMADVIARGLRRDGTAVDRAASGEEGLALAATAAYDAIVLDILLPGIDGFETCRRLRTRGDQTPILMLTARDSVPDRVHGLNAGADDYLVKPFAFVELRARLAALVRRGGATQPAVLAVGDLRLDPAARRVWRGAHEIELTQKQYSLLETFMRHPGQVLTREQLLAHSWERDFESHSNVVDVYVNQLRDRLDRPFGARSLETVRGVGYRLRAEPRAEETSA